MDVMVPDSSSDMSIQSHMLIHYNQIQRHHDNAIMVQKSMSMSNRRSQHQKESTYHMLIIGDYIRLVISRNPKDHIQRQARWNNAKDHYTKYKDIIKDYELERMINSKTFELQLIFSRVTFLRGRLGKLIQKLLLYQKCMGYLVRAYYSISSTRCYKDDSCWSTDLKSMATEDIISIRNFMEVLVLNHYVLVRKIFGSGFKVLGMSFSGYGFKVFGIEHIIVAGVENHPPMLEKSMYHSWASHIRLFIKGKKHGRMMLDSIDNGPLVYLTVEENGQTRPKKYSKLTEAQ
uniref:Uncharacterized protein n=1 Tax=Tanacetum cinerariifolium TaxID=118510 RepID=A0A6L2JV32_TANCI|nr:hypothetical protein [Tanacetum cinerariifolium]